MTKKEIQLLFDYDAWADGKLFEAIASLSMEQCQKDLKSSFGGILGTLVHILSANIVWSDRWRGKTPALLKSEDFPSIEVVKKKWDTYHHDIGNFLQGLSEEKFNAPFQYTDFKGNVFTHPLSQQMQHKVNHSTYHRGQIVTMMRQLEMQVVSTDLINYMRQKDSRG